jgi:nuclear pore complex protein Nup98-Nup96
VDAQLFTAKSHEERSFLYLTGGNVPEACASLLAGSNFHLAQMVSQIGGDHVFRETMAKQLKDWSELNVSSEINEYIRAIYELLAGRTLECEGKTYTGPENKVPSFKFSARFNLDWKRAFGLRLWYGILQADDIANAVVQFANDLDENGEPAKPLPWFILQNENTDWKDPDPESREDSLWGLLKFYADQHLEEVEPDEALETLSSLFPPENTSGNPADPRLSFQLINLLRGKGYGASVESAPNTYSAADTIAKTLAANLEHQIPQTPEILVVTAWIILHIIDEATRTSLIKTLLERNAKLLVDNDGICAALSSETQGSLRIPFGWLCAAKASYARAEHDSVAEARWLIEGDELTAAHDVLCHTIGPTAVIEGDFNALREVLGALIATDVASRVDWEKGAGLYFDYIELQDLQAGAKRSAEAKGHVKKIVKKMSSALEALGAEGLEGKSVEERIALKIMSKTVVDAGNRDAVSPSLLNCFSPSKADSYQGLDPERILRLPLSENAYLEQSKVLSLRYYEVQLLKAR